MSNQKKEFKQRFNSLVKNYFSKNNRRRTSGVYGKNFRSVLVSTATEAEIKLPVWVQKYEVRDFSVFRKFGKKVTKNKQNIFQKNFARYVRIFVIFNITRICVRKELRATLARSLCSLRSLRSPQKFFVVEISLFPSFLAKKGNRFFEFHQICFK